MDQVLGWLGQAWQWMEAQGIAGDILQGISGTVLAIPYVGSLLGLVFGLRPADAWERAGDTWGLKISQFMRRVPVIGPVWEFVEDPVFDLAIRVTDNIGRFLRRAKQSANKDDGVPVGLPKDVKQGKGSGKR
ncbi:hypothetical protein KQI63_09705 [bacterium]|nr:hypothetical protein [bacterium]